MSAEIVEMPGVNYKERMEGRQIKAARAMLGMSQSDLCKEAEISRATLNDLENDTGDPRRSSSAAVEAALRSRGVVFIDDGKSVGVTAPKA
jgi:DNA-binding XRE family transcriptional regulator